MGINYELLKEAASQRDDEVNQTTIALQRDEDEDFAHVANRWFDWLVAVGIKPDSGIRASMSDDVFIMRFTADEIGFAIRVLGAHETHLALDELNGEFIYISLDDVDGIGSMKYTRAAIHDMLQTLADIKAQTVATLNSKTPPDMLLAHFQEWLKQLGLVVRPAEVEQLSGVRVVRFYYGVSDISIEFSFDDEYIDVDPSLYIENAPVYVPSVNLPESWDESQRNNIRRILNQVLEQVASVPATLEKIELDSGSHE